MKFKSIPHTMAVLARTVVIVILYIVFLYNIHLYKYHISNLLSSKFIPAGEFVFLGSYGIVNQQRERTGLTGTRLAAIQIRSDRILSGPDTVSSQP